MSTIYAYITQTATFQFDSCFSLNPTFFVNEIFNFNFAYSFSLYLLFLAQESAKNDNNKSQGKAKQKPKSNTTIVF